MAQYRFKGHRWTHGQGCLLNISAEPRREAVYSEDVFESLEEAKLEWLKDPWIKSRDGKTCTLTTEIVRTEGWD